MLHLNNDNRWDSTYEMIDHALKLRGPIDAFIVAAMNKRDGETQKGHREQLPADQLKSADWKELEELHALLKPFKSITMELQGNLSDEQMNGAIFDLLPSFDYLLQHLEDAKKKFTGKSTIATCVNLAWLKLNEYYEKTDLTSVYVIATILDPRMKYGYFERRWATRQDWIEIAKANFEAAYERYRENAVNPMPVSLTPPTLPPTAATGVSALKKWKFAQHVPLQQEFDELHVYTHSPVEASNIEPRTWWIVNQSRFPILATMVRDILSIPAMSSEVERVFSEYRTIFTIVDMQCKNSHY